MSKLPKSPRLYVGIDQSIVCTSIAFLHEGEMKIERIKSDLRGPKLLCHVYDELVRLLDSRIVDGVAIEGYAYGATGKYFNLGELGGVIRMYFEYREQTTKAPLVQVPPTTLKKYVTGTGKATKDIIIKELYKKYDLDLNDNNDADAAGLAILAQEFYETQFHIVKAYRADLHKTCEIIVGDHPNKMTASEFLKDMPDEMTIAEYERIRKEK